MNEKPKQTAAEILHTKNICDITSALRNPRSYKEHIRAILARIEHAQPLHDVLDPLLDAVGKFRDHTKHPDLKDRADAVLEKLRSQVFTRFKHD